MGEAAVLTVRPATPGWLRRVASARHFTTVSVAVIILVSWQVLAMAYFRDGHTLPQVPEVIDALVDRRHLWWPNARHTLGPTLKGIAIGTTIAVLLALISVLVSVVERPLLRIAVIFYSLPVIAVAPVLQVTTTGDAPATALAALFIVFPMLVALVGGLRAVPPNSWDVTRGFGGGPWHYMWKVRVLSALPSLFAALRIGFPAALIGSMVGEFMGAPRGLAVLMIRFSGELDAASTWATGVIITTISTLGYGCIGLVQRHVTRFIPAVTSEPPPRTPRGWRRMGSFVGTFSVAAGAMLLAWIGYLEMFGIDEFVGKRPSVVWDYLTSDATAAGRREVFDALSQTIGDAGVGLVVGWSLAIVLAMSFVLWSPVERAMMPLALALRSVPLLAILPLLTLVFGRDLAGTVIIVAIVVFFPTLVLVLQALRSVPPDLAAISHAYNASPATLLRKVRVPMALPSIFASLRITCPAAMLGALLAEWLATGKGMGYLLLSATTRSAFDQLWAGTVVTTAIAVSLYTLADALERAVIERFAPS